MSQQSFCKCRLNAGHEDIKIGSTLKTHRSSTMKIPSCTCPNSSINELEQEWNAQKRSVNSVEDILEKLGGFSRFQIYITLVLVLCEIPSSMVAISPVLITRDNFHYTCSAFNNTTLELTSNNLCHLKHDCSGQIEYDDGLSHTSIVIEWHLYCDKRWIVELTTSLQMAGSTVGSFVFPQLADRFGRRPILISICLILGVFGSLIALSPNVIIFGLLRFIVGLATGGLFIVYLNYLIEFLTPKYRTICGCVTLWSIGVILTGFIGYFITNWRILTFSVAFPAIIILVFFPWIPESPRWFLVMNRTEDAAEVFNKIAKWNGKEPIMENEINRVQKLILIQKRTIPKHTGTWKIIWKSRTYRRQIVFLMGSWFSMSLIYYGLSFNTKHLHGDPYLNLMLLGLTELPGPFTGLIFNNRFGRKRTSIGFFTASATMLSIVATLVLIRQNRGFSNDGRNSIGTCIMIFTFVGRYCNAAAFGVITCFSAESFPTIARGTSTSFLAFAGNLGGIIAPQILLLEGYFEDSPYLIFCLTSIMLVVLCSFLKEEEQGNPIDDVPKRKDSIGYESSSRTQI